MAAVQPVMNQGPPMVEVKNIFFKACGVIKYFEDESQADAIDNNEAFQYFNRSLECSTKHGCVLLTFNNEFYLLRVSDVLLAKQDSGSDNIPFKNVKKLEIANDALPATPNILSLSHGEDFLAVDTVRGDTAWVVIFRFADFVNQSGACRPFCEVRCPSATNSRISSICWNPGDGMNNLLAINTDDGALFLAKILGTNNVELNRFADGGIRCCCWSPKGKQLVVGRFSGSLSQLRLDLTEAKQIPGPEPGSIPVSILWTQTTQFLVVFHKENFIDFMQLDVPKGAAPTYTNSGDIFISEIVPDKCSCYFLQLQAWNVVLTMTNSASDVVVLVKQQQNSSELWIPGDITDNRRAAFVLDNYARGASLFYGSSSPVVFSEVESYSSMPMVFLLSQRGSLIIYSVVNSDSQAASLTTSVSAPIPDTAFTAAIKPVSSTPSFMPSNNPASAPFFQVPQPQAASPSTMPVSAAFPVQTPFFQNPQAVASTMKPVTPTPAVPAVVNTAPVQQPAQKPRSMFGMSQAIDPRQLGTSTLPTAQDMAVLQKAVEEKRREMTTQLQKGVPLKGLEEDNQCAFVIAEVRKFEQRLADFKKAVESNRNNLARLASTSFDSLEKRVLASLNVVEDFTSDMVSITSAQKEEVEVLKERILNHFSQLEYAKSLVERSRDPRYLEHLRSRPLDPASQQKFEEIKKLHNYLRNQVAECRRYFYEQNRKREMPIDRVSCTQLIYLTLSNHSKIIRRLKTELDSIKEKLGLGRHGASYEDSEYLSVCEASYVGTKKTYLNAGSSEDADEITLNDLTAGISKVKLNRDSDRPDKKPVKLSNRKLFILKRSMSEVTTSKVKADETAWTRSPSKSAIRPKPMIYPAVSNESMGSKSAPVLPTNILPTAAAKTEKFDSLAALLTTSVSAPIPQTAFTATMKPVSSTPPFMPSNNPTSAPFFQVPQPQSAAPSTMPVSAAFPVQTPFFQNPQAVTSTMKPVTPTPSVPAVASTAPVQQPAQKPTNIFVMSQAIDSRQLGTSNLPTAQDKSIPEVTTSKMKADETAWTHSPSKSAIKPKPMINPAVSNESMGSKSAPVLPTNILPTATFTAKTEKSDSQAASLTTSAAAPIPDTAFTAAIKPVSSSPSFMPSSNPPIAPFFQAPQPQAASPSTMPVSAASPVQTPFFQNPQAVTSTTKPVTPTPAVPAVSSSAPVQPTSGGLFGSSSSFFSPTTTSSITAGTGFMSSLVISDSANKPVTTSAPSGLFSSSTFGSTTTPAASIFGGASTFGASQTQTTTTTTSGTTGTSTTQATLGAAFGQTKPSTDAPSGLFSTSTFGSTTTPTPAASIFGGASAFGASQTQTTTSSGTTGTSTTQATLGAAFGQTKPSTGAPSGGLFSTSTFGSTTTPTPSASLFGGVSTFGSQAQTTTTSGTAGTSTTQTTLGGAFGQTKTSTDAPSGLFSTSTFGSTTTPTPAASIFGGASTFGSQAQTTTTTSGTTGTTTTQATFGEAFGQTKPSTGLFSSPAAPAPTSPVFGGSATFGSTSPFGSTFGGSAATTFGTAGSGSIFGSSATSTSQPAGFGTLAQQSTTTPAFGESPFAGSTTGQQQASVFGTPTQQKPAAGLFTSTFGSPTTASTGSVFGGSGGFGSSNTTGGTFSAGAAVGGVAQQGFGFSQAKPAGAPAFGSPPSSNPVFGGGATFGSTSPFGSSFSSTAASSFGATGTSVFGGGGGGGTQTAGFGALAQQGSTSPGFGTATAGFGSPAQPTPPQQQPSLFGSPQQQSKPVFGGQAFSSWR